MHSKSDLYAGLFFIVGFSFFAGMVFTTLLARYGVIELRPF